MAVNTISVNNNLSSLSVNLSSMGTHGFDPYDYPCNTGLFLPAISEYTWASGVRCFLYFSGLMWCFLAVAIVADIFMVSIERITSKTHTVRIPDDTEPNGYKEHKLKVWNDTVANLSLMALGTSAPEILLSVIEICGNKFVAGELGPGTIVGSAAFNLLCISAICILAIPSGEVRKIASVKVFAVTSFAGVFAYVWIAIVLLAVSPNRVELWEAVITFLMFPLLLLVSYLADRDFCLKPKGLAKKSGNVEEVGISMTNPQYIPEKDSQKHVEDDNKDGDLSSKRDEAANPLQPKESGEEEAEIFQLAKKLGRNSELSEVEAAKILVNKIQSERPHDRGWYRINATRGMTGGRKLLPTVVNTFQDLYQDVRKSKVEKDGALSMKHIDYSDGGRKPVIEFTAAGVAVMENEGKVRLGVKRSGKENCEVKVRVLTLNGTAMAVEDYKPIDEIIKFEKNENVKSVFIDIVDDNEWEPDEFFFVKLHLEPDSPAVLGNIPICQVTIINDDEPGTLAFAKPSFIVKESTLQAVIPIMRTNGADGHVSIKWRTKDITAFDGKDYVGGEGILTFDNQETTRNIDITLKPSNKAERDESFQIELFDPEGGAALGKLSKCIVTIVDDEEYNGLVSRIVNLTRANLDSLQLEQGTYIQQFYEAMNVNGGDIAAATPFDYVMHFLTFFWKIMFAFIPPAHYLGGWPTFIVSLSVIGFLTAIIGDLASIFGCLLGLKDAVTAITLVAMGTSMPDTFASKQAAQGEKTADSSIGNINGSNSVNVFLGLGLPWLIATIYWKIVDGSDFEVPSGSLGFSIILFTTTALVGIGLLIVRRVFFGGELGGPTTFKYISAIILVLLWGLYVLLSALQSYGIIDVPIGG